MPTYYVRGHCFYKTMTMSKIFKGVALLLSFVIMMASCKSDERMIEKNAMGYLMAMGNYRIAEAEAYATNNTINNTLHFIENTIMPNLDSSYLAKNTPATIVINDISIINDTAAEVSYTKTTPIQVQEGKLNMVKENQEWKAEVLINIPQFMNVTTTTDSMKGKEMDARFKGKLKPVAPDTTRRSRFEN